jgi:transposase
MRDIRAAIGATTVNPDLLTSAETLQYQGYLRREEANALIMALAKDGVPIRQIVRRTGRSRGLVRNVIKGQATDVFRSRESTLDAYRSWLEAEWAAGSANAASSNSLMHPAPSYRRPPARLRSKSHRHRP